ncbi:hypothetical protein ACN4EK_16945 [Pantanalinema rosaneae CENA516]|uniref:hypothetical protein n=1 Tax=Pantanalinema rosaneae TaxID=1620701 RepID=UPI003D6E5424
MKLFTIGDSVSQGFMSNAAARTDLCFSTLLAKAFGLTPDSRKTDSANYFYPEWQAHGVKLNLESVFRKLERRYGSDISTVEWATTLLTIDSVINESEDYYERGKGKEDRPYIYPGISHFHNVAIQGFSVADAWQVTPNSCQEEIKKQAQSRGNNFLQGANAPFHRVALKVLNPTLDKSKQSFSQLDWLGFHTENEGVENLILWLGNNNALSTVLELDIKITPNHPNYLVHKLSQPERWEKGWNLWHPADFEAEYSELMERVDNRMSQNKYEDWKVFIANIPMVTVIPFAKGVGETSRVLRGKDYWTYFKYYTYFPFGEAFAVKAGKHLTMQDAIFIDDCILEYNKTIQNLVDQKNAKHGKKRYHIVDISQRFSELAYKRNEGKPTYQFPDFFHLRYPQVNTKYYHVDKKGKLKQGGIFSLDGVHPSAITHGLIAHEFLKVMQVAGLQPERELQWQQIFESDDLYQHPISIMQELYHKDELATHIIRFIER